MKNIFYSISVLLLSTIILSCEKEEKFNYTGGNQVYFATSADSSTYSFAVQNSELKEDIVLIPVAVSGIASDADREIKVEIVKEGTTAKAGIDFASGGHYLLGKTILKKGEITTHVPITVFRQSDISNPNSSLDADKEKVVLLRIVPDKQFLGNMGEEALVHKLKINDILTKPENWDSYLRRYFGEYGPVKYQFIIDHLGRYEFLDYGENAISEAELAFYKDKLRTYLMEYEKENGPLYDEGNVKVTF